MFGGWAANRFGTGQLTSTRTAHPTSSLLSLISDVVLSEGLVSNEWQPLVPKSGQMQKVGRTNLCV